MFITEATLFSETSVMVSPTLRHCEQQTLSLLTTHVRLLLSINLLKNL